MKYWMNDCIFYGAFSMYVWIHLSSQESYDIGIINYSHFAGEKTNLGRD